MRLRQIKLLPLVFLITLVTQANAFNKSVWDRYDQQGQMVHLLGAFEGLMINPGPEEMKLYECFTETKINLLQLHELVAEEYNSSYWKHSNQENVAATIILISAMKRFCIAKGYNF